MIVPVSTVVALVLGATSSSAPDRLALVVELEPIILDYELPGHPNTVGRGHVGAIARGVVRWEPHDMVRLELGVTGRLPFALDVGNQAAALPIFAIEARPYGDALRMRFGSLDTKHGYHPALADEPRLSYGRNIEETYNRFIPEEAAREIGGDPFAPGEHGAQLIAATELARLEIFLDWQLLETAEHREKFNFGMLGEIRSRWIDVGLQFRLTHYGGQLFTKSDPLRNTGLDPVRQPETMGVQVVAHPLVTNVVSIDIPAAFVGGHMRQDRTPEESWHYGFEIGADVRLFEAGLVGYRRWQPRGGDAGYVSEDSEPVYSAGASHRVVLGLDQRFGPLSVDGRLSLVVADATPQNIQYLAVTRVTYRFEADLLGLDGSASAHTP